MINAVIWFFHLMNFNYSRADVVRGDNVNSIVGPQRENREACKGVERLHHIELRGLRAAGIAEDDGGAENGTGYIGKKLMDHVLAEFFRASVGIVVRAVPVNRSVLGDDFVLA